MNAHVWYGLTMSVALGLALWGVYTNERDATPPPNCLAVSVVNGRRTPVTLTIRTNAVVCEPDAGFHLDGDQLRVYPCGGPIEADGPIDVGGTHYTGKVRIGGDVTIDGRRATLTPAGVILFCQNTYELPPGTGIYRAEVDEPNRLGADPEPRGCLGKHGITLIAPAVGMAGA